MVISSEVNRNLDEFVFVQDFFKVVIDYFASDSENFFTFTFAFFDFYHSFVYPDYQVFPFFSVVNGEVVDCDSFIFPRAFFSSKVLIIFESYDRVLDFIVFASEFISFEDFIVFGSGLKDFLFVVVSNSFLDNFSVSSAKVCSN